MLLTITDMSGHVVDPSFCIKKQEILEPAEKGGAQKIPRGYYIHAFSLTQHNNKKEWVTKISKNHVTNDNRHVRTCR